MADDDYKGPPRKVFITDEDGDYLDLTDGKLPVNDALGAKEAKQDDVITELGKKADLTETQPVEEQSPITGFATSAKQLPDDHKVTVSNPTTNPETGLATSVKQDDVITELGKKADLTETQPVEEQSPITGLATSAKQLPDGHDVRTIEANGVPAAYNKQTGVSELFNIQKGQLNKMRLRPEILNEHAESSREIQAEVNTTTRIVGQIFKTSQDNISAIDLAMESAGGTVFDNFDTYADDAALQAVWVADDELPVIETTIVYQGTKSMELDMGNASAVDDEWIRTLAPAVDYSGYTGSIFLYSNKEYKDVKLSFFIGDGTNTRSTAMIQDNKNVWTQVEIAVDEMTEDGVVATDATAITKIGFRVDKKKRDGFAYIDLMTAIPAPGTVTVRLWDMGTDIPTGSTSIDDGTQYVTLGDLGITGKQISEDEVDLLGGFRTYHLHNFVAGVALEFPANVLLNVDHYYAITINWVDTDVSIYGPISTNSYDYYENGFAFTAPDEATAITLLGANHDLMFAVYSTQDVYVINMRHSADAAPGFGSTFNVYIEDSNMTRTCSINTISKGQQTVKFDNLSSNPCFMEKGSKIEEEYDDDFTDSVSIIDMGFRFLYIPPTPHG